jgi:hypothetical protein
MGSGFGYYGIAGVASTTQTNTVLEPLETVISVRLSRSYKNIGQFAPDEYFIPRETGRLTVGCNVT